MSAQAVKRGLSGTFLTKDIQKVDVVPKGAYERNVALYRGRLAMAVVDPVNSRPGEDDFEKELFIVADPLLGEYSSYPLQLVGVSHKEIYGENVIFIILNKISKVVEDGRADFYRLFIVCPEDPFNPDWTNVIDLPCCEDDADTLGKSERMRLSNILAYYESIHRGIHLAAYDRAAAGQIFTEALGEGFEETYGVRYLTRRELEKVLAKTPIFEQKKVGLNRNMTAAIIFLAPIIAYFLLMSGMAAERKIVQQKEINGVRAEMVAVDRDVKKQTEVLEGLRLATNKKVYQ